MFGFLGFVWAYALLSFGGMLPHSALGLHLALAVGVLGLLAARSWRGRAADLRLFAVLAGALAIGAWLGPRLGVPLFAGAWAFFACSEPDDRHVIRFFHFLLVVGLGEALLGLFQYFVAPGWIFGYINAGASSSGTLINPNHFAGLLEMLVPAAFGLSYLAARRHRDAARSYSYLVVGAVISLALIFSASRMGIVSLFATLGFMALMIRMRASQKRIAMAMGFGLVGLILGGALWIGVDAILERYALLLEPDAALREGRMIIYRDSLKMIVENPWGVGIDGYRDVFRQYQTFKSGLLFDHAHNDYLETAAEWGVVPAAAFWAFVMGVLVQSVRTFLRVDSPESRGILLASSGAIFAILVHSLADFNLQILSNSMLFCVFVGIALGGIMRIERGRRKFSRESRSEE